MAARKDWRRSLGTALLVGLVLVVRLVVRVVRRWPLSSLLVVVLGAVVATRGMAAVLVLLSSAGAVAAIVRWRAPQRWARWVAVARLRVARRRFARVWPQLCHRLGLEHRDKHPRSGAVLVEQPRLSRVRRAKGSTAVVTARVQVPVGGVADDITTQVDRIATAAGARWCRTREVSPGVVDLALLFGDPLLAPVMPCGVPVSPLPDLGGLPIGLREDGDLWRLNLRTHVLVVGATGAGKGSIIWSTIRALMPLILAGLVEVWAIDCKAGMELAWGRSIWARFATTTEDAVQLLEEAAEHMQRRATSMAGVARDHSPTRQSPHILVLVDEIAVLTAYQADAGLKKQADKALSTLCTQGRAPGVTVMAALQDPRKEVISVRNLFPTKIGARLDSQSETDMVMGADMREAGALCHLIASTAPGTAYVVANGEAHPTRVRAAWMQDDDIRGLVEQIGAGSTVELATSADPQDIPAVLPAAA